MEPESFGAEDGSKSTAPKYFGEIDVIDHFAYVETFIIVKISSVEIIANLSLL